MVTVRCVQCSVPGLDHTWVMIFFTPGGFMGLFEVTFRFPGRSIVNGDLHRQAVSSRLEVIADQEPVAVPQPDDLRASTGVRKNAVRDFGPRFSPISGTALL